MITLRAQRNIFQQLHYFQSHVNFAFKERLNPQRNRERLIIEKTINIVTVVGGIEISPKYAISISRQTIPAKNPLEIPITNDVSILYFTLL